MVILIIKKTNQKNHVLFIPNAFNQNTHHFGQFEHFNQLTFWKTMICYSDW
jgi:hypothetical protein